MKEIRNITANVAFVTVYLLAALSGVGIYFLIANIMDTYFHDVWVFLNNGSSDTATILRVLYTGFFAAGLLAITFSIFSLLAIAASHLLGRNITASTDRYPKSYSISDNGYTNDDRRCPAQRVFAYYHAYTVKIELSFEEIQDILSYLRLNNKVYYDFPKSFLMPDNVSWLWPRISLHTVRCIAREIEAGGVVLLTYRYVHPKRDSIRRTDAIVRIIGNLQHDTYKSDDVLIGPINRH